MPRVAMRNFHAQKRPVCKQTGRRRFPAKRHQKGQILSISLVNQPGFCLSASTPDP